MKSDGRSSDDSLTESLLSQSFLQGSTKSPKQWVDDFDALIPKKLKIVNRPGITRLELVKAQGQVRLLVQWESTRAIKYATAQVLQHLKPDDGPGEQWAKLSAEDIVKFYEDYAKKILKTADSPVTCDGLCIVAFSKIKARLSDLQSRSLSVDLCCLKNWSHTFLRITFLGSTENESTVLFYDPWYQRVISDEHTKPCVFEPTKLAEHMDQLRCVAGKFIGHTDVFNGEKFGTQVQNTDQDYSYFVLCRSKIAYNDNSISMTVPDPSVRPNRCIIL